MPGRWDFGYFQVWVTRSLRYIPIPHQVLTTGPFFIFWTEGAKRNAFTLSPGLPVSPSVQVSLSPRHSHFVQ